MSNTDFDCTVIVVVRDRFSTTEQCLSALIENTPPSVPIRVVIGGAPEKLKTGWTGRFGDRVQWIFEPHFLNPSESRNVGLRHARTRLAVLMDNDVYVRPGWFEPLIQCQAETGATMVVPLVLDEVNEVHTAGNDLYITYRGGKAYACKELRYGTKPYFEGCNLKRSQTDYGELHCQLVEVGPARELNVYDERLREAGEVDSGLAWAKAGLAMWFEPKSVVHFDYPVKIRRIEDFGPFRFKWDAHAIAEGYRHFERKWGMDITEGGQWPAFLTLLNSKLGIMPRIFPNRFGLFLDHAWVTSRAALDMPKRAWHSIKARLLGSGAWRRR